ncbi:PIN domain-containing protein [Mariniflexile sp. HNIBRBA6329]|uniref:PIN domain-containing protein n=1 Tax=Mariniflexile sp. HNIBRBA6329 TaxID=3373088 RepID=UPI0037463767
MGITTSWKKILVDTTVIVKVISYKKYGKEINEFANKLMEYLADTEAQITDKKTEKRQIYVSSISIAEIIDSSQPNGVNKTKLIVQALNADNIEIVDFDEDVADLYNIEFIDKLGVNYQKDSLSKWGELNSKVNREILTKDLMILGCALYKKVDVVLCFDKGMYRIGRECGINMVYIEPKYFNHNDSYIFEFYTGVCDKELKV